MEVDRVKKIYAEIDKYTITLDPDPVSRGPQYLQEIISECRGYLNRSSLLLSQIHQEQHAATTAVREQEVAYEVAKDDLLVNDNRVRNLPALEDRMASVNTIIRSQLNDIEALKADLLDLQHIEKVVKARHQELKATMTDVRTQRSLIRDFLDTGSFYGKEDAGDKTNTDGIVVDVDDLDDLEDLIQKQLDEDEDEESSDENEASEELDEEDELDMAVATAEDDDSTEEVIEEAVSEAQPAEVVVEEEPVEEESPQDVGESNGADHNEDDSDEEDAEIEAFLDDEDDELSAILDSID